MRLVVVFACLIVACDGPAPLADAGRTDAGRDAGPPFPSQCENVNPSHCLLPWPSSFFLADDPSTTTGRRIEIPEDAMPANRRGVRVDPSQFARFDGFSPATSIMTSYPGEVDPADLHGENDIDATLDPSSTTLIIDAESGELVPHFAELDGWAETDPARSPLYLRPAVRLQEAHRYVVAIRGLHLRDGSAIEPSPYFQALRDGTPLPDATDIEGRRAHFDDIFAIAEAAGAPRAELIEAWDFETASGEAIWGDLVHMRDDALERVGADGIGCTVLQVTDVPDTDENIYRQVLGTVTVPLYLMGTEPDAASSRLRRGADGLPVAMGNTEVQFTAQIPVSLAERVRTGGAPGRLEVYGHGLFGERFEVEAGWHRDHQNRLNVVTVAVDWWGMSIDDLSRITLTLQSFGDFIATNERLQQAVINVLVLARSFRGVCADLPEMQLPLEAGGTAPSIDTTAAYYYGNSQGGIMGGVVAGVATDIERFVLGVTGMSYPTMIKRSVNWRTYDAIMQGGYPEAFTRDLLLVMSASLWDIAEPSTYAPHLVSDPLPGTPPHFVLMQVGVGDAQVPNVSADLEARTIGIPYLTPSPYEPWGLPSASAPVPSALVIYDIPGADPAPPGTVSPLMDNEAHEGVRRSDAAMMQIDAFWQPDGMVTQTCDGVCDPN